MSMSTRNEKLIGDARERFAQMPKDIFRALEAVVAKGGKIYAPHGHAGALGTYESNFSFEPRGDLGGRLCLSEITGLLMVHNEARLLQQAFNRGGEEAAKVWEVLGLQPGDWPSETIKGMADFVQNMGYVAGIRERVVRKEERPLGTTVKDKNLRFWWDHFSGRVVDDGFLLGVAVSRELVKVLQELASRTVIDDERMKRWGDYSLGVEYAAALYLEILAGDVRELLG